MSLDHQAEVEHAVFGEAELSGFITEDYACDDGGAGGAKTATEWDRVVDVDVGGAWEGALAVAFEDVEGCAGDEVCFGVEGDAGVFR